MTKLTYTNHEGATQEIEGCTLKVDALDRHWIWCEQLDHNIVYKTKGRENALLAAIDSLLFAVRLRDERIADMKRTTELAQRFVEDMKEIEA